MFSEILGQEKATNYLQKLVRENRTPGALLFCGPEGIGKRKAALEFAKALNCEDYFSRQNGEACGACASCQAIEKGTHPDVTLVDFLYQARLNLKEGADEDTEYEKEIVGRTIRGPVARTELEPGQLSWLANAIEGGDAAGAEFVRWANDLAEAEEIQRAIALASKQGAK